MRFFDRTYEIGKLLDIKQKSLETAQFTIVTGRRRIGKTSLILKAFENETILYFFVSRKAEAELCDDFLIEIQQKLGVISFGRATSFSQVFDQIMQYAKNKPLTLFIDEFQDFARVNKSVFSEMQRIWDINKNDSRINLIVCGSVNSMMNNIFRNEKEPLFGRQTQEISVKPFAPSVLKEILSEYHPGYSNDDLLALYAFTGGVAKYVEHFVDNKVFALDDMLRVICQRDSVFINEGKITLIEEFGKDYGTYFSILSAIATGHNTRAKIEEFVGKEVGGYLTKLDSDFGLVRKNIPLFDKPTGNNMKYILNDNFFVFWFRFVYKYDYMLEIGAYDKLRQIMERDYAVFSGLALEKYFRAKFMESGDYTRIGGWWNRKGDVEIDIIVADELSETAIFCEVKRQPQKIDLALLESRKDAFLKTTHQFKGYKIDVKGLSLEDM
ncbi:MAG: ATP-binding protein [Bacteroidales bacterium]|nr:ATP-binding protein [Bacteroidales bacterium]